MDDNDGNNSQMGGFQQQQQQHSNRSKMPNCQSSGLNTNTALSEAVGTGMPMMVSGGSMFSSSSGLDPMGSLSLIEQLGGSSSMAVTCGEFRTTNSSYPIELEGRGLNSGAHHHLAHYSSNPNLAHLVLGGGGGFSEMINPYVLSGCAQTSAPLMYGMERMAVPSQEECQSSGDRAMTTSPSSKRKRDPDPPSPLNPSMNVGGDPQRDVSGETSDSKGSTEKKQRNENITASRGTTAKQAGKQSKDSSQAAEDGKDNYIHVRARRGQATNSHSLAERVRREKISERMRLLQELVPGCSKITGKAVMLDEIINYVQSLQQQVEFLSMKLATVNPELNFDIDQILSKDILHSRGGSAPLFGFNPAMSSPHPLTLGLHQTLPNIPTNSLPPYHSLPQGLWDGGELHSLLPPIDFNANPASGNLGPSGSSKTDLQR